MAADTWTTPGRAPGTGPGGPPSLGAVTREDWLRLVTAAADWLRGLGVCLAGAAVMQGALAGFPVMLWGSIPVSLPLSAVAIALVGLRDAPQWGPLFAALVGLLADAAGAGMLGTTAWAYLPAAAGFALVHRHLRRDHPLTLILFASLQALVQTAGAYLGLRLAGLSAMPGHVAAASILLSALLGFLAAVVTALFLRFSGALGRQLRSSP